MDSFIWYKNARAWQTILEYRSDSSIFHTFSLQTFSGKGAKTISMLDPALDKLAGQRVSISYYDEVAINKAYDCADRCPQRCQNHGYARRVRGRCRCFCPPFIGENFVGDIQFYRGSENT